MDLLIKKKAHIVIARDSSKGLGETLDLHVDIIDLDSTKGEHTSDNDTMEHSNEYALGFCYDQDNGKFFSQVGLNYQGLYLPFEVWKARSLFNKAGIVWYDKNRLNDVVSFVQKNFADSDKIIPLMKFAQNNE